jgi:hypothetical protein
MRRLEHAATVINSIVDNEEVVVAGKLVFVYTVQSAFLGCAAEAITIWNEACILNEISDIFRTKSFSIHVLHFSTTR